MTASPAPDRSGTSRPCSSLRALLWAAALAVAGCGAGGDPPQAPGATPAPPEGMAWVGGGAVEVGAGADEVGMPHERPAFAAEVRPFYLDLSPVTVARFAAFEAATGHRTDAERLGDGAVMDTRAGAWRLVPGADWRRPFGPDGPHALPEHPVTQVSWADAAAFCAWDRVGEAAKRLPTEVEWEHAARGARNSRRPYAWGDRLREDGGRYRANTWTGTFPGGDDADDGYGGTTSPVGAFGETPLGLTDMGGNVWEWTASWYRPYPLGPDEGTGPGAPAGPSGAPERVQRGGSFLCNPAYCHGYRVSARSHATPESASAHVGFRCAADASGSEAEG